MDYIVVKKLGLQALQDEVKILLAGGYLPAGGIAVELSLKNKLTFYQAMYKI